MHVVFNQFNQANLIVKKNCVDRWTRETYTVGENSLLFQVVLRAEADSVAVLD